MLFFSSDYIVNYEKNTIIAIIIIFKIIEKLKLSLFLDDSTSNIHVIKFYLYFSLIVFCNIVKVS